MPIYEYACNTCEKIFEELVLGSETIECPDCSSADLNKLVSGFAVGEALPDFAPRPQQATPAPITCGSCVAPKGSGSGSTN